jgi:hypothetical protein
VILMALAAAFLLGGCVVHEEHRHERRPDVIYVVPAPHEHEHPHDWR